MISKIGRLVEWALPSTSIRIFIFIFDGRRVPGRRLAGRRRLTDNRTHPSAFRKGRQDEQEIIDRLTLFIDPGQLFEVRRVRPGRAAEDANHRLARRMVLDLADRFSLRLHPITDDGKADRS